VVFLDRKGRFFRVRYRAARPVHGVARHVGELLTVFRFERRYRTWWRSGVAAAGEICFRKLGIEPRAGDEVRRWQQLCHDQSQRWGLPVARWYRFLLGLCAGQVAAELTELGVPRDLNWWTPAEWGWFGDFLRLERWHLATLLNDLLASTPDVIERKDLIIAFESTAADRLRRLDVWRRGTFLAMAGVAPTWGAEPQPQAVFATKDHGVREALFWYFRGTVSRPEPWTARRRRRSAGRVWAAQTS
jgi:hypothetical protein